MSQIMSPNYRMEPMLQGGGSKNSKWGNNEVEDLVAAANELEEAEANQEIEIDPEKKEILVNQLNVSITVSSPFSNCYRFILLFHLYREISK